jgi:hypothetical protein
MALMTIAKLIKRASRRNDDLRFPAVERSFDRLMKPVSGQVPRHLPEGPRTARPLILRGLISMNKFRTPSAQGSGPVSQADVSR